MKFLKSQFTAFVHQNKRYLNQGEATLIVQDWLKEFKEYLPPKDVTEHAKGAHDAIDDLLTWVAISVPKTSCPDTPELSLDASEGLPEPLVVEGKCLVVAKDREQDNTTNNSILTNK